MHIYSLEENLGVYFAESFSGCQKKKKKMITEIIMNLRAGYRKTHIEAASQASCLNVGMLLNL